MEVERDWAVAVKAGEAKGEWEGDWAVAVEAREAERDWAVAVRVGEAMVVMVVMRVTVARSRCNRCPERRLSTPNQGRRPHRRRC